MYINPSGNVGLGTISPGYKLDVNGPSNSNGSTVGIKASNAEPALALFDSTQNRSLYLGYSVTNDAGSIFAYGRDGTGAKNIVMQQYGGNVGIGTTAPGELLSVNNGSVGAYYSSANYGIRGIFNHSGNGSGILSAGGLQIASQGTNNAVNGSGDINFFVTGSNSAGALTDGTYSQALKIRYNGNVGIGTTSPSAKLHVVGAGFLQSAGFNGLSITPGTTSQTIASDWASGGGDTPILIKTQGGGNQLYLATSGNVGIGKTNPTVPLDVVGNITATGTIEGGNIKAKYQDVAEWVPSSEQIPTGTVVVLDATKSNQVISSTQAYDTRVAGVVSEKPGIALGEGGAHKVLVATTGRVLVNVDASNGPIHIGDLLVTSEVSGTAMKSTPVSLSGIQLHRPGTLIGKALEPLEKGSGKILVLLSLQ